MTYKKKVWSVCETASWIWKYASHWSYKPYKPWNLPPRKTRKVISIDYKDHELRVLAFLKDTEGVKATSGIDQSP